MKSKIRTRIARTALFALFALVIGAMIGFFQIRGERASVVQKPGTATAMPGIKVGGDFELVNQDGETVTQADYAGMYKLIYFGFTSCPAICPTELQKISQVMKALGDEGENIQPLFITIDPERDTVEVMHSYVSLFHPRLAGLTGSRAQIDAVLKNYRVFAAKVQNPDSDAPEDYTMDHSSFIYLMSPDDELISMYRVQDDTDYITGDIRKHRAAL